MSWPHPGGGQHSRARLGGGHRGLCPHRPRLLPGRADVTAQLENLFFNRFISATPDPWFSHLPRYARAAVARLEAAAVNPARDATLQAQVDEIEDLYAAVIDAQPPGAPRPQVEEVAFLIEEFRVSLFAQQLRTALPISAKRIRQAIRQAT